MLLHVFSLIGGHVNQNGVHFKSKYSMYVKLFVGYKGILSMLLIWQENHREADYKASLSNTIKYTLFVIGHGTGTSDSTSENSNKLIYKYMYIRDRLPQIIYL